MTWLKLSDDFAEDCVRADLSDAAFRTHVEGLLWSMRRGTDGLMDRVSVRKGLDCAGAEDGISELVAAGFWAREGTSYRIVHHMEHQPEAAVVKARKDATAERVRRHRLRKAGVNETAGNGACNALPGSGRDGAGLDGNQALEVSTDQGWSTGEPEGAVPPQRCAWCKPGETCPDCG